MSQVGVSLFPALICSLITSITHLYSPTSFPATTTITITTTTITITTITIITTTTTTADSHSFYHHLSINMTISHFYFRVTHHIIINSHIVRIAGLLQISQLTNA